MHLFFRGSPRISSFLESLRGPSKKRRLDTSGQALGEHEWLPLSPGVVGLSDEPFKREGVSSESVGTEPPDPLVESRTYRAK